MTVEARIPKNYITKSIGTVSGKFQVEMEVPKGGGKQIMYYILPKSTPQKQNVKNGTDNFVQDSRGNLLLKCNLPPLPKSGGPTAQAQVTQPELCPPDHEFVIDLNPESYNSNSKMRDVVQNLIEAATAKTTFKVQTILHPDHFPFPVGACRTSKQDELAPFLAPLNWEKVEFEKQIEEFDFDVRMPQGGEADKTRALDVTRARRRALVDAPEGKITVSIRHSDPSSKLRYDTATFWVQPECDPRATFERFVRSGLDLTKHRILDVKRTRCLPTSLTGNRQKPVQGATPVILASGPLVYYNTLMTPELLFRHFLKKTMRASEGQ